MLMTEFYRQAIVKMEKEIRDAEADGCLVKVAKLQAKRLSGRKGL